MDLSHDRFLSNLLQSSFICNPFDVVLSRYWQRWYITHKNSISGWCLWRDMCSIEISVCIAFCVGCTFCRVAYSRKTVWGSLQVEIPQGVFFFYFLVVPAIGIVLGLLSSTNSSFSLEQFREEYRLSFGKKIHATSWGMKGCGNETHRLEAKRRITHDIYNLCSQSITCHNSYHLRILRNPRHTDGHPRGNFLAWK